MKKCIVLAVLICNFCAIAHAQKLYPVVRDGQWGYINDSGSLVVNFRFDKANPSSNGMARARKGKDLYVFFEGGRELKIEDANFFEPLANGVFKVQKEGKWWLCDSSGENIYGPCDRIWAVGGFDSLLYVVRESEMGVIDLQGNEILAPEYPQVRVQSPMFFSVMLKNKTFILIDRRGEKLLPDSLFRVQTESLDPEIFSGMNTHRIQVLFNSRGEVIDRGRSMRVVNLDNGFLAVFNHRRNRLYDARRDAWIDSSGAEYAVSNLENSVVLNKDGKQFLFTRDRGLVTEAVEMEFISSQAPFIVRLDGRYGLLDSGMKPILTPKFSLIYAISGDYFAVSENSFSMAVFNARKIKWESDFDYLSFRFGEEWIKAYGGNSTMDMLMIEKEGISEIVHYENVRSINVSNRNINENWTSNVRKTNPVQGTAARKTGWVQEWDVKSRTGLYRLVLTDSTGRSRQAVPAIFDMVNVLPRGHITLARYGGVNKNGSIAVKGMGGITPNASFRFVDDSTGKMLGPIMQYVNLEEYLDSMPYFSGFANGQAVILDKKSFSTLYRCTYLQSDQPGAYSVYRGGSLTGEFDVIYKTGSMKNSEALKQMGFFSMRRAADYKVGGGEWMLLLPKGKMLKPSIAGAGRITDIAEMKDGFMIVTLENGKQGVIDSLGNTIVDPEYDNIVMEKALPGHFFCGKRIKKYGLISSTGEILTPPMFSILENKGEAYRGQVHDSTFLYNPGSMSATYLGRKIRTSNFVDGNGFVRYKKGFQMSNVDGEAIEKQYYRAALNFHAGYAPVKKLNRWGLVDAQGNLVLEPKFAGAKEFGYSSAIFKAYTWKFYSPEGKKIKGPSGGEAVSEISPGIFIYKNKKQRYGIFNEEGKRISGFRFAEKPIVFNDMVIGSKTNRSWFFSPEGKKLGTLPALKSLNNKQFLEEAAIWEYRKKEPEFLYLKFSAAQMRAFGLDSPWQNMEIPMPFSKGLQIQKKYLMEAYMNDVYLSGARNFNFINGNGEPITEEIFVAAEPMHDGVSICRTEPNKAGLLDRRGFWIIPPVYSDLKRMNGSIYSYEVEYEYELKDGKGEDVFAGKIDAYSFHGNMLKVGYRAQVGWMNGRNKVWEIAE